MALVPSLGELLEQRNVPGILRQHTEADYNGHNFAAAREQGDGAKSLPQKNIDNCRQESPLASGRLKMNVKLPE